MGVLRQTGGAGLACAAGAAAIGILYLVSAGAPTRYPLMNLAALVVGLAAYATIRLPKWRLGPAGEWVLPGMGLALLATAWLGTPVEGAARWIAVGPLNIQLSLLVLPAMIVMFSRRPSHVGALGMVIAAVALAMQPDRAMAGALAVSMLVLLLARRERPVLIACMAGLGGLAATMLQADDLPAVAYVDAIFYSSFEIHALVGIGVIVGACLLSAPGIVARGPDPAAGLVFAVLWAAVSLAAGLGNYPTPVVGYGGAAIVGYLLSLAVLAVGEGVEERRREHQAEGRGRGGAGPDSRAASLA